MIEHSSWRFSTHSVCVLSGCFRNITTGVMGHIDSPNYPHKYLINSTCEWVVSARDAHSRLLLTFEFFSMEGDRSSKKTAEWCSRLLSTHRLALLRINHARRLSVTLIAGTTRQKTCCPSHNNVQVLNAGHCGQWIKHDNTNTKH